MAFGKSPWGNRWVIVLGELSRAVQKSVAFGPVIVMSIRYFKPVLLLCPAHFLSLNLLYYSIQRAYQINYIALTQANSD